MNTTPDRAFSTMQTLDHYTIVLRPDTNGTFIAYVPAISGCHAWAETAQTAREELNHVFAMICEEYSEEGRSLPQDVELVVAHAS
jgi:predicted RNase H-like HicB family nuclease